MNKIKQFREFLLEEDTSITIYKNSVDISNYDSISHFDSNSVMVNSKIGMIVIKGDNLVVSKLLNDEVLVTGKIINIELR